MKSTIMLVDDDETFLQIAQPILESNDYDVRSLNDVVSAESMLSQFTPDLIISDIEMPGRTGIEFFRSVHASPDLQNVPFIFLTANSDVESIALGKELGSDDYLTKPVNYKLLLATVKGKLKKKESIRSSQTLQIEEIKSQLFRMFSHEMRTPLTSIMAASEMLADPDANFSADEMTIFLQMLQSNSRRLTSMFDDFLLVTRIESGEINGPLFDGIHTSDLHGMVQSIILPYQISPAHRGMTFRTEIPPGPVAAAVHPNHLEVILARLIDNAVKFSPPDGTVTIDAVRSADHITISVRDTGCGIPADSHSRIFEKFHQVDRATNEQQGSGLGLFIASRLTLRYHGRLWFDSTVNAGSTFFVQFPTVTPVR